MAAGKRDCSLRLAVASVSRLPVPDKSCDIIMNVFAPDDAGQFGRVLRPGGVLLKAVPREEHLLGLKKAVYEKPYLNPPPVYSSEGFNELERVDIDDDILLDSCRQINNLFMMTPYYYKTSADDQAKLLKLEKLETELRFSVFVMQKI